MNWKPKPPKTAPAPAGDATRFANDFEREAELYWSMAAVFEALEGDDEVAWCLHMATFYEILHQARVGQISREDASTALADHQARRPSSPMAMGVFELPPMGAPRLNDEEKARIRRQVAAKG